MEKLSVKNGKSFTYMYMRWLSVTNVDALRYKWERYQIQMIKLSDTNGKAISYEWNGYQLQMGKLSDTNEKANRYKSGI